MSAVGIDRKSGFERRMSRFVKIMGEALSPLKKELIAMPFGDFGWGNVKGSKDEDLKQVPKLVGISAGILGSVYLFAKTDWTEVAAIALTTTAAVGGLGAAGLAGYLTLYNKLYKVRANRDMRYVRIVPHANTKTTTDGINHLIKSLWRCYRPKLQRLIRGREWFQLLFSCDDRGDISIYLGFPQDRWSFLIQTIKSVYPTSEIIMDVPKDQIPVFTQKAGKGKVLTWRSKDQAGFPLQTFDGREKITRILEHMEPGTAFAVTFSPTSFLKLKRQIKKTRHHLFKSIGYSPKEMSINELDADIKEEIKSLEYRQRPDQHPFEVVISIHDREGRDYVLESLINAVNSVVSTQNSLHTTTFQFRNNPIQYAPQHLPLPSKLSPLMVWTGPELANVLHLPDGKDREAQRDNRPHIYDRIPHIQQGQSLIPVNEFTKGVYVGRYINPGQEDRPIFLDPEQLRYHGVLLGKTGSGKTALALEITTYLLIERLNKKTGGFTVIDPKATFAKNLLTRINKLRVEGKLSDDDMEKIHYFDITSDYSFGINPLERPNNRPPTRTEAEAIIEQTLGVFKAAWANESILFERFGRLVLKALLADPDEQHTILAIPEILREQSPLRDRLVCKLRQGDQYAQEIARDLEEEVRKGNFIGQKMDPLINRLTRIKESETLRKIFGQKKTTINSLEWMNEGHIILFNTEGLLDDQITILMGYILYEYHRQCRKRNNPNQNHYLIVDEAHNVRNLDVLHKKIIPEDREFGLSLLLMTQMLHQFPQPFFDAITEVAGTYMSCEVGAENARLLEKITQNRIDANVVQGMQKLRTIIDATDSKGKRLSFIVKVAPPTIYHKDGSPTYYGQDGERTSREKAQAFADCMEIIGHPLLKRDCLPNEQIEQAIDEYISSLDAEEKEISPEELVKQSQTPKSTLAKKFAMNRRGSNNAKSKRLIILKRKGDGSDVQ